MRVQSPKKRAVIHKDKKNVTQTWKKRSAYVENKVGSNENPVAKEKDFT